MRLGSSASRRRECAGYPFATIASCSALNRPSVAKTSSRSSGISLGMVPVPDSIRLMVLLDVLMILARSVCVIARSP